MKVINSSYDIRRFDKERDVAMIAEGYAICYEMEVPPTYELQCAYIRKHRRHESQLEHSIMTVKFVTNIGITHDLIRHRHTAYGERSTRWCNFSKERFGSQLTFIDNKRILDIHGAEAYDKWVKGLERAEAEYMDRINSGQSVDEARGCLPKDLSTKILVSTNFREWRNIFKLRCESHAHYQINEIMRPLLDEVTKELPCVFDDIPYWDGEKLSYE